VHAQFDDFVFEVSALEEVALARTVAHAGQKTVILAQLQFAPELLLFTSSIAGDCSAVDSRAQLFMIVQPANDYVADVLCIFLLGTPPLNFTRAASSPISAGHQE
jgi:hypothetical protein